MKMKERNCATVYFFPSFPESVTEFFEHHAADLLAQCLDLVIAAGGGLLLLGAFLQHAERDRRLAAEDDARLREIDPVETVELLGSVVVIGDAGPVHEMLGLDVLADRRAAEE